MSFMFGVTVGICFAIFFPKQFKIVHDKALEIIKSKSDKPQGN